MTPLVEKPSKAIGVFVLDGNDSDSMSGEFFAVPLAERSGNAELKRYEDQGIATQEARVIKRARAMEAEDDSSTASEARDSLSEAYVPETPSPVKPSVTITSAKWVPASPPKLRRFVSKAFAKRPAVAGGCKMPSEVDRLRQKLFDLRTRQTELELDLRRSEEMRQDQETRVSALLMAMQRHDSTMEWPKDVAKARDDLMEFEF